MRNFALVGLFAELALPGGTTAGPRPSVAPQPSLLDRVVRVAVCPDAALAEWLAAAVMRRRLNARRAAPEMRQMKAAMHQYWTKNPPPTVVLLPLPNAPGRR